VSVHPWSCSKHFNDLHDKTVLFTNPETVAEIRLWVEHGGSFEAWPGGEKLQRKMNTLIRGRPIHSHVAERTVNLGNTVQRKYAPHESEHRISGKIQAKANGTQYDARAAAYEFEEAHKDEVSFQARQAKPSAHWRDVQTKQVRKPRAPGRRWRNKEVTSRMIVRFALRAHEVTPAVAKAAKAAAAASVEAKTDGKSRTTKRKDDKTKELNAAELKRNNSTSAATKKHGNEWREEQAAACDPIRLRLGMVSLLKPPVKEVLALECEASGIFVSKGRTEPVPFPVKALRDHHGGVVDEIPKATAFEAGSKLGADCGLPFAPAPPI